MGVGNIAKQASLKAQNHAKAASKAKENANLIRRHLMVGTKLNIELDFGPGDSYSLASTLIGVRHKHYFIVDMSSRQAQDLIMRRLENIDVVVKGVLPTKLGHVFAFRSQVICKISKPSWLLFIKIPRSYEVKAIREHKRLIIEQRIEFEHQGQTYKGTITDISAAGCGLMCERYVNLKNGDIVEHKVNSSDTEGIHHRLPDAKVVNAKAMPDGGYLFGLEFVELIQKTSEVQADILMLALNHED